jgi:hypothetical protein
VVGVSKEERRWQWAASAGSYYYQLSYYQARRQGSSANVLGPVPEVDVMAKRPQGLLNVGTLSARMAVLRSCALDI